MNEISINYGPLSDKAILALGSRVHLAITTEPCSGYFTSIEPPPATLRTQVDSLAEALAMETSVSVTALRRSRRETLVDTLTELAAHLELQAKGDMMKLAATGFELKKKGTHASGLPLGIPENLRLSTTGTSGELLAKCNRVKGARSYHGEHAFSPDGPWTAIDPVTTSQHILFTGLPRGKDVYIRVRAFGATGYSGWSDIAVVMVV